MYTFYMPVCRWVILLVKWQHSREKYIVQQYDWYEWDDIDTNYCSSEEKVVAYFLTLSRYQVCIIWCIWRQTLQKLWYAIFIGLNVVNVCLCVACLHQIITASRPGRKYVSVNKVNIGSDNDLASVWHQAVLWTNVGVLLLEPLGTNFSEIWNKVQTYSYKKMSLKMLSAKWWSFCLKVTSCYQTWCDSHRSTHSGSPLNKSIFFYIYKWADDTSSNRHQIIMHVAGSLVVNIILDMWH